MALEPDENAQAAARAAASRPRRPWPSFARGTAEAAGRMARQYWQKLVTIPPPAPASLPHPARIDRGTLASIILFVVYVRIVLILIGYFLLVPPKQNAAEGWRIWQRWDGRHYLEIANYGYSSAKADPGQQQFRSRFPPLYPAMIAIVDHVPFLSRAGAGVAISVTCLCAASVLLFSLLLREGTSTATAWWAVLFLNCHPASYFGGAVYTESLYLLLTIGYFYVLRTQRNYPLAAGLAALQMLTRQSGLALLPVHAVVFLDQLRRRQFHVKNLVGVLLPFAAYAAFIGYISWLRMPGYSGAEQQRVDFILPFSETAASLWRLVSSPKDWTNEHFIYTQAIPHVALAATALLVVIGFRKLSWEYSLYGVAYVLMLSVIYFNHGAFRYSFGLCTVPMILASLKKRWLKRCLLAASVLALLFCFRTYVAKHLLI